MCTPQLHEYKAEEKATVILFRGEADFSLHAFSNVEIHDGCGRNVSMLCTLCELFALTVKDGGEEAIKQCFFFSFCDI